MWRKDPATPWEDAAWVWVDSEGSPWEPFAASSKAALAALALDTGTLYDAVSSARSAAGDAAEEEAEAAVWEARTQQELSRAAERYPAQNEHRDRLAAKGIELPTNAFSVALEALARHGQFSAWLKQRSAEQALSVDAGRSGSRKTAPKKASPKKASTKKASKKASPKKASPKKASTKKASKKASPKKASPKKASPKKASPKKASPKKASPKKASPKNAP
jgi:hypothetical protein